MVRVKAAAASQMAVVGVFRAVGASSLTKSCSHERAEKPKAFKSGGHDIRCFLLQNALEFSRQLPWAVSDLWIEAPSYIKTYCPPQKNPLGVRQVRSFQYAKVRCRIHPRVLAERPNRPNSAPGYAEGSHRCRATLEYFIDNADLPRLDSPFVGRIGRPDSVLLRAAGGLPMRKYSSSLRKMGLGSDAQPSPICSFRVLRSSSLLRRGRSEALCIFTFA